MEQKGARELGSERNPATSDVSVPNTLAFRGSENRSSAPAEAARSGPTLSQGEKEPSPTAAESARRWLELRELRQGSPTAEESARQWRKARESGEHSPTAEESARRWAELRARGNQAGPLEDTSDKDPPKHNPPRKVAEDNDEEGKGGGKRDRSHDDGQGL